MRLLVRGTALALMMTGVAASAEAPPPDLPGGDGPRATSGNGGPARYDAVGYAVAGSAGRLGGDAVTAAHATLPPGSYAEVTALDSGRTIAVLVSEPLPARPDRLIALSPGALRQLGITASGPVGVRVRAIDPGPADRAALNAGKPAAARINAPAVLLTGLRKQLSQPPLSAATPPTPAPAPATQPHGSRAGASYPPLAPTRPAPPATRGGLYVQIAALADATRARALAKNLGGIVQPAGRLFRVRLGPYATPTAAAKARDDAAARGYASARIVPADERAVSP